MPEGIVRTLPHTGQGGTYPGSQLISRNVTEWSEDLERAGRDGNILKIENLWRQVPELHSKTRSKAGIEGDIDTGLLGSIFAAIENKRAGALRILIRCKSTLLEQSHGPSGGTALHEAVRNGDHEIFQLLLSHSRIIKAIDKHDINGNTALHEVTKKDHEPLILQDLLRTGADIDARNRKDVTPLHAAVLAHKKHAEQLVAMLIDNGAEVNTRDRNGTFLRLVRTPGDKPHR